MSGYSRSANYTFNRKHLNITVDIKVRERYVVRELGEGKCTDVDKLHLVKVS